MPDGSGGQFRQIGPSETVALRYIIPFSILTHRRCPRFQEATRSSVHRILQKDHAAMRLRIHRGTKEIGGTCIEIEADGKRLVLDVGLPLNAPDDEATQDCLLPDVAGFRAPDASLLGVLVSHAHRDHYGLVRHIHPDVPVWMGKAAHAILTAASRYGPTGYTVAEPHILAHRRPVTLGPFRVTPYLVDHSAFDAYALLIEADGKRVVYSGDFRGHGRKASLFESMLANPPGRIDALLMEGTTVGRPDTGQPVRTEQDLEQAFVQVFKTTQGLHLVWTASQNIDRLVTVYRAAKRTGRLFLIDLYTAVILAATGRDTLPQSHWPDVRLYIPHRQRVTIKTRGLFADLERHSAQRVYPDALPGLAGRAVLLFRPMMMDDRGLLAALEGAAFTHSMWDGYLKQDSGRRVLAWLETHKVPWATLHTSGHAAVADLKRLAVALAPRVLVPIHSDAPERFGEHFARVVCRDDGVWWAA